MLLEALLAKFILFKTMEGAPFTTIVAAAPSTLMVPCAFIKPVPAVKIIAAKKV
jgi:hypothetical protein